MASTRSFVLTFVVAVAMLGIPTGEAQLGGILDPIRGSVRCSLDGNNQAPPFPNAELALQSGYNVVSTTTTNAQGEFSFMLNPVQYSMIFNMAKNCSVVVKTPLSTCDANLPSDGGLQSTLNDFTNPGTLVEFTYDPRLNVKN